ncbi:Uncharacterised protein [Klebsiella michiganensis]|uniref:Uncharacterized protein n=1 Tax=Klebsiella michiganensis TaxID=1134687 RepID=A0A7H4N4X4_9ENTR|nr:Uncharacterised protein [Klebsiella michiganensis]
MAILVSCATSSSQRTFGAAPSFYPFEHGVEQNRAAFLRGIKHIVAPDRSSPSSSGSRAVTWLARVILPHASWLRGRFSLQPRRSVSNHIGHHAQPANRGFAAFALLHLPRQVKYRAGLIGRADGVFQQLNHRSQRLLTLRQIRRPSSSLPPAGGRGRFAWRPNLSV